jgi:hypothetical protein
MSLTGGREHEQQQQLDLQTGPPQGGAARDPARGGEWVGASLATRRGRVTALAQQLVARATGGGSDDALYAWLRRELLTDPAVGPRIPRYVRVARDLGQFWDWIKEERPSHAGRTELIWTDFGPILDHVARLETAEPAPRVTGADAASLRAAWERARERCTVDPGGAVRTARALLEGACRRSLAAAGVDYPAEADLPALYALAAERLGGGPAARADFTAGVLLDAGRPLVDGIAGARRRPGAPPGVGARPPAPAPHHAELAVNLAGSLAVWLAAAAAERAAG